MGRMEKIILMRLIIICLFWNNNNDTDMIIVTGNLRLHERGRACFLLDILGAGLEQGGVVPITTTATTTATAAGGIRAEAGCLSEPLPDFLPLSHNGCFSHSVSMNFSHALGRIKLTLPLGLTS